eukprot:3569042-Heterocapsa_arctica.AAC.1
MQRGMASPAGRSDAITFATRALTTPSLEPSGTRKTNMSHFLAKWIMSLNGANGETQWNAGSTL